MQNHTSFVVVVEQNPVMHEEIKCSLHCILLQRLLLSTILYCSAQLSVSQQLQRNNASETLAKSTFQISEPKIQQTGGMILYLNAI